MSKKVMISVDNENWSEVKPWNPYTYEYGAVIEYPDGTVETVSDQYIEAMLPFGCTIEDFLRDKESE